MAAEDLHDRRINGVLLAAMVRRGTPEIPDNHTPVTAALAKEDADFEGEAAQVRRETLHRMLGLIFQNGIHPADAMKNLYAIAHALRPDLLQNLTCGQIAALFGESKAAHSWRVRQIFARLPAARGGRPITVGWQKSPAAVERYRAAQRGNTNRRKST